VSDPREEPVPWEVRAPARMSVTLGRKLDNCPRDAALYLKYRDYPSSSGPLLRGSLVHLFHERMMGQLIAHGEKSLFAPGFTQEVDARTGLPTGGVRAESAAAAAAEVAQTTREWVDELAEETGWPLSEAEVDEARVMAYHIAVGNEVDPETVVALEQAFVLELEDGRELIGKVDVASIGPDGVLQVDDLKSSFYVPPEDDVQKLVQAPWYAAGLLWGRPLLSEQCPTCRGGAILKCMVCGGRDAYPEGTWQWGPADVDHVEADCTSCGPGVTGQVPLKCPACDGRGSVETLGDPLGLEHVQWVRCRQVYPRFLNPSGFMSSRGGDALLGRADLRERVQAAARVSHRLQRGLDDRVWPAKSGPHCSECTAEAECPLPRQLRRFAGAIQSVEQASEAYEWLVRQQSLIKATRAEVINHLKAANVPSIAVGSERYGFAVSHSTALRRRGQHADWDGLGEAVEAAANEGAPFDVNDWLRQQTRTEFKRIKEEESE
jgi:hypothetical protein